MDTEARRVVDRIEAFLLEIIGEPRETLGVHRGLSTLRSTKGIDHEDSIRSERLPTRLEVFQEGLARMKAEVAEVERADHVGLDR